MIEVTLHLPETLLRKIRALTVLEGGSARDIEQMLIDRITSSVDREIISHVNDAQPQKALSSDYDNPLTQHLKPKRTAPPRPVYEAQVEDPTGLTDGLGDEAPDEDDDEPVKPVKEMANLIPKKGGLTDKDLEKDMEVEDPAHEATADAATFADHLASNKKPDKIFAEIAGIPPAIDPEDDVYAAKRKKRGSKSKAKVSFFTGNEESRI